MTASISKLLYSWLFMDPSEHHHTKQISKFNLFWNQSTTMLNNVFNLWSVDYTVPKISQVEVYGESAALLWQKEASDYEKHPKKKIMKITEYGRWKSRAWFMPSLHLLRSSYDGLVYDFPCDFGGIVGGYGLRCLRLHYLRSSCDFMYWAS